MTRLLAFLTLTLFIKSNSVLSHKVFIVNGSPEEVSQDVEILDPFESSFNCSQKPSDYWNKQYGTFGTLLNETTPIICGGDNGEDTCYGYFFHNDSWRGQTLMQVGRWQAAAVSLSSSEMWITGGYNSADPESNGNKALRSTEILTFKQDGTNVFMDLPVESYAHHVLKMNATHYIFVPGYPFQRSIWMFDMDQAKWTQLPGPKIPRKGAFCGLIHGSRLILAGGSNGTLLRSTEILDFGLMQWEAGPDLPIAMADGASAVVGDSLIAMGGNVEEVGVSSRILTFSEKQGWVNSESELRLARAYFSAIQLPIEFNCK